MSGRRRDLIGHRFFKLVVKEFSGQLSKSGNAIWICDCDCGGSRLAVGSDLTCGKAKSCGCSLKTQFDCKIPGCEAKAVSKNLCNRHYKRSRNPSKTSFNIFERFALKTKVMPTGCIEWTGHVGEWGYGQTSYKGEKYNVHRLAWILHFGEIAEGLNVCHKCDNPPCVNIDHLFLGTQKDNIDDAIAKGRFDPERIGRVRQEMVRGRS